MDTYQVSNTNHQESSATTDDGSFIIGFLLGGLLDIVGIIIALLLKKPKTTKGLVFGLLFAFIRMLLGSYLLFWLFYKAFGG